MKKAKSQSEAEPSELSSVVGERMQELLRAQKNVELFFREEKEEHSKKTKHR